jgi:hypothetical protein
MKKPLRLCCRAFEYSLRFVVPGFRIDPLTAGGTSVAVFGLEIIHIDRRTASFAGDGDNSFVLRYFFVFFIRRLLTGV